MAYDIDSSPWYKATAILAGMCGVVIFSTLIAFITTTVDHKLKELRKGKSTVVEQGHSMILGWNERVVDILRELVTANSSEPYAAVVILANRGKEDMDDFLRIHLPDRKSTRIVTRSGSESLLTNLEIVSIQHCKSIIILATCGPAASDWEKAGSDAHVVKTTLAAKTFLGPDSQVPIVAEIYLDQNRDLISRIAPTAVTIDTDDILSTIMVQTSRSVGLCVVYNEIVSFDGCEMYLYEADWRSLPFGQLAYCFSDGIPMGIRRSDGSLSINPAADTIMREGESILILAEDNSTIDFQADCVAKPRAFALRDQRRTIAPERDLIIGWTNKTVRILREYGDYLKAGGQIDVLLRTPCAGVAETIQELNKELKGIDIRLIHDDPLTREGLLATDPFSYNNILILSQGQSGNSHERTDSETMVILLLLRQILDESPQRAAKVKLITEILDLDNQPLVARTGVNDFIISNRIVRVILAQLSENVDVKNVYDDLFSEEGSEIYLKPADLYFTEFPVTATYADLIAMAHQRQEICLGVKLKGLERDAEKNYGIKLIPEKNREYTLNEDDALVVLAEDET